MRSPTACGSTRAADGRAPVADGRAPVTPTCHDGGVGSDRETLDRWADFGGIWRVVASDEHAVTVSMCRCDGGEEVQRLTTRDPDLITWLTEHPESP